MQDKTFQMRVSEDFLNQIDDWRRKQPDLPSRAEAIRRLVARASEFDELRKLLREEQVELAIYVVPMVGGKTTGDQLRFELTDDDRKFLKQAGIRFS